MLNSFFALSALQTPISSTLVWNLYHISMVSFIAVTLTMVLKSNFGADQSHSFWISRKWLQFRNHLSKNGTSALILWIGWLNVEDWYYHKEFRLATLLQVRTYNLSIPPKQSPHVIQFIALIVYHAFTAILCLGSHLPWSGCLKAEFAKLNSNAKARAPDNAIQPNQENAKRAATTLHSEDWQVASGPISLCSYGSALVITEIKMGLTLAMPAPRIQKNQRTTNPAISVAKIPKYGCSKRL